MYGNPITIVVSGVANGPARINLIFREAYWTAAGVRAFDIIVNGVTVESGLDPYALVGGDYLFCLSYDTTVISNTITIVLDDVADSAFLTGLEVLV